MELEIDGRKYKSAPLDPFLQLHIARRIAPAMYIMASAMFSKLRDGGEIDKTNLVDAVKDSTLLHALMGAVGPLVEFTAHMSNDDFEYVTRTCVTVVSMESGQGWQKVMNANGAMQFDHIDAVTILQLAAAVIRENLAGFSRVLAIFK